MWWLSVIWMTSSPFMWWYCKYNHIYIIIIYIYGYQIGTINHCPLFKIRSWNNGMRCMSCYVYVKHTINNCVRYYSGYFRQRKSFYFCLTCFPRKNVTSAYRPPWSVLHCEGYWTAECCIQRLYATFLISEGRICSYVSGILAFRWSWSRRNLCVYPARALSRHDMTSSRVCPCRLQLLLMGYLF